jgi:phosphoglycolate phosphatase
MLSPLLVFDLDGTLIDSYIEISKAANLTRATFGYSEANPEVLHQKIGLPARELFQDLNLTDSQLSEMVKKFREYLSTSVESGSIFFPGVLDFLKAARENEHKLAIATNKPTHLANKLVSHCELNGLVHLTVGVGDFAPKPSPQMISHCIEYFNASSSLMFGDRMEDIQAAKLCGVPAIGVAQGFHTEMEMLSSGAILVFPDFVRIHEHFTLNVWGNK